MRPHPWVPSFAALQGQSSDAINGVCLPPFALNIVPPTMISTHSVPAPCLEKVTIRLRPLPGSPWLKHDPAFGTSIVDLNAACGVSPVDVGALTFSGVTLNGRALKFRVVGAGVLVVSPRIAEEGDRLTISGLSPAPPARPPQSPRATHLPPAYRYGLQAPVATSQRHP